MTETEAHEVVGILGDAYRMSQQRLDWYARALLAFPAGPVAEVLEQFVLREKSPPTVAVILQLTRQRLEAMGAAAPTFARQSERLEQLVIWRSVLEDPIVSARERADARDRIGWMDPPCTQGEWREARALADARHAARNQQLVGEGKPPYRPRPPLSWPHPPAAVPEPILSPAAHKAGLAALADGIARKLDQEAMTRHVLDAVRAAEASARAAQDPEHSVNPA